MKFFNMFGQPYLDGDDGANLGGGGTPTDTAGQQTEPGATNTTGSEGAQQAATEQPKFKVKFNHEEKELTYDEAVQYAQKGLNYDRIYPEYEKLRNNPHLSYLEQKAQKLGITVEQLIENDRKYEEQEALNQLVQQNIPPEYAKEMLENRKFRESYQSQQQQAQAQQAKQKMFGEFLEAYPDVKNEDIPPEVWQAVKRGESLLNAYIRYENKQFREKLAGFEQQQQTQAANDKNAAASAGSAKTQGKTGGFISREQFDTNKSNQKWVMDNLDLIEQSRKHWK